MFDLIINWLILLFAHLIFPATACTLDLFVDKIFPGLVLSLSPTRINKVGSLEMHKSSVLSLVTDCCFHDFSMIFLPLRTVGEC